MSDPADRSSLARLPPTPGGISARAQASRPVPYLDGLNPQQREAVETLAAAQPNLTPNDLRNRFVIGTPDEVAAGLWRVVGWGASHLICSLGAEMFTLWSDSTLELFAHEVLPRVRSLQASS